MYLITNSHYSESVAIHLSLKILFNSSISLGCYDTASTIRIKVHERAKSILALK